VKFELNHFIFEANIPMNLWRNSMNYGALAGLAMIVIFLILHYAGISNSNSILQWLSYLPLFGILFIGTRNLRDKLEGGFISYGRSLGSGVLISLFCGILLAFFMYLFMKFIDTEQEMIKKVLEQNEQAMLDRNMSEEEIEQSMEMTRRFMTPGLMSIMAVFGYTFMGFIFSLILSFFLKRENKTFDGFIKSQES
jgi:predicted PurR-regulated permease PerM